MTHGSVTFFSVHQNTDMQERTTVQMFSLYYLVRD